MVIPHAFHHDLVVLLAEQAEIVEPDFIVLESAAGLSLVFQVSGLDAIIGILGVERKGTCHEQGGEKQKNSFHIRIMSLI
jgi:hypothetical protein